MAQPLELLFIGESGADAVVAELQRGNYAPYYSVRHQPGGTGKPRLRCQSAHPDIAISDFAGGRRLRRAGSPTRDPGARASICPLIVVSGQNPGRRCPGGTEGRRRRPPDPHQPDAPQRRRGAGTAQRADAQRPRPSGGTVPPGAKDGGGRPPGRRRGARFQQSAHRHHRLQRPAARRPRSKGNAAHRARRDPAFRRARRRRSPTSCWPSAAASRCRRAR